MRKVIWRNPLRITSSQELIVPRGTEWLSVGQRDGHLSLWYICDPAEPTETRTIRIIGTGPPIEETAILYIGTADCGNFVWHVFEELQ
jgi:hypothetical protein